MCPISIFIHSTWVELVLRFLFFLLSIEIPHVVASLPGSFEIWDWKTKQIQNVFNEVLEERLKCMYDGFSWTETYNSLNASFVDKVIK